MKEGSFIDRIKEDIGMNIYGLKLAGRVLANSPRHLYTTLATIVTLGAGPIACKDSTGPPVKPVPEAYQSVTLQNFSDIIHSVTLKNVDSAIVKTLRGDSLVNTKTIRGPNYSQNLFK